MDEERPLDCNGSEYLITYYNNYHEQWYERCYKTPWERLTFYLLALTFIATWSSGSTGEYEDKVLRLILYVALWAIGVLFFYDLCSTLQREDQWLKRLSKMLKVFRSNCGRECGKIDEALREGKSDGC